MINKYIYKKKRYIVLASLLDLIGYSVFGILSKFRRQTCNPPNSILIIRLDHLGDVLLSSEVPRALKGLYPKATISFLTSSYSKPLLVNHPYIDEIIVYDPPWFSKNRFKKNDGGMTYWKLSSLVRKKKFDLGIGLRGDLRENFLLFISGARERIGYGITGGGFLLSRECYFRQRVPEREHTLDIVRALGGQAHEWTPEIFITQEEKHGFFKKVNPMGLEDHTRWIGLQLGSGYGSKDWKREHFYDFLEQLNRAYPEDSIVLIGNQRAKLIQKYGTDIFHHVKCVDLVDRLSLRELLILLKQLHVMIGYDSGPAHIASASGVPTVFLFSGTNNLDEWKPMAKNAFVLKCPVTCSPCHREICPVEGHPCMTGITPGAVMKAVKEILNSETKIENKRH